MKKVNGIIVTGVLVVMLMFTLTVASAAQGDWKSSTKYDMNGASQVYTTYTGGGNSAETVHLVVKMSTGGTVGQKTVGATVDQKVEHTCWGQPLKNRYGIVEISSKAYHNPGFNA